MTVPVQTGQGSDRSSHTSYVQRRQFKIGTPAKNRLLSSNEEKVTKFLLPPDSTSMAYVAHIKP
jgi:hypothetical protein